MLNKIIFWIKNPIKFLIKFDNIGILNLSDEKKIKLEYKLAFGKYPDLKNPKTYCEKVQWLKLHDHKDIYTKMVDKYEVKQIVGKIIGEEYIIPTIGVYNSFDEINFDSLPNKFVIKCTHDSGGIFICKNKNGLNKKKVRKFINKFQKRNFYKRHREWPYKNAEHRIIVEQFMQNNNDNSLKDYKFFCFNGEPKFMYLSEGLENHQTAMMSFYDMKFEEANIKRKDYKSFKNKPDKPINFDKMIELSKVLSKGIPHVRVDWYEINGKLYFGELTFSTNAGLIPFEDNEMDLELGKYIILPND